MLAVVIACLKRRKIPALRCAHDFLTGTPMIAMPNPPNSAYLGGAPPSSTEKYLATSGMAGTGTGRHHSRGCLAGGADQCGPPPSAEYGYAHICGGGLQQLTANNVHNHRLHNHQVCI